MKRIIMLAMVLFIMIVSIGGCLVVRDADDHHGRDRHEKDKSHDRHEGHRDGDRH